MQLFLVRHADSGFGASSDHQRPLSDLGKQQAKQTATYLKNRIQSPETQIICSDALRTETTASIIQHHLGVSSIKADNLYYHARVGQWCDGILAHQSIDNLILVGHNPTISFLSKHLNPTHAFEFRPACVLHCELEIQADGLKLPAHFKDYYIPDAI